MYQDYFMKSLDQIQSSNVKEAMAYSLFSSGKRLRSYLLIEMAKAYGLCEKEAYPCAMALEMIHTYSLIHDDLPAMDDDDYRRGQLTCHKQFDEAIAILAGDGLLTEAFFLLSQADYDDRTKVHLISQLAKAAGANGMILGQDLDMATNALTLDDLIRVHHHKTGQLFAAGFKMACILANRLEDLDKMEDLGLRLGLAFQIQDDVFDVTKTTFELGKDANSDVDNDKKTVLKFMSIEQAQNWLNELYDECIRRIMDLRIEDSELLDLIGDIKNRRK